MEKQIRLQLIIMGLCFLAVPILEVVGGVSEKPIAVIGIILGIVMIYLIFRQAKNDVATMVPRNSLLAGLFLGLGLTAGTAGIETLMGSTLSPVSMISMLNGCCCITFGIRLRKEETAKA